MCCLFGLIDYGHQLDRRQKTRMVRALARECEARGTDAAGIAYHSGGTLHIDKRPGPARRARFTVPGDARVVMGHTRMTTQGSAKYVPNNHPCGGKTGRQPFALAHNVVLYNDVLLRKQFGLPNTRIKTDSYVAVQLLERQNALDFASLRNMAEQVQGTFVFIVLDAKDNLYFVRGDNPLCLYHYPQEQLYLYASTEEILKKALSLPAFSSLSQPENIPKRYGDLLKIDPNGTLTQEAFDADLLWEPWPWDRLVRPRRHSQTRNNPAPSYWDELKSIASAFGYTPDDVDKLRECGLTAEELEEMLYCGEI